MKNFLSTFLIASSAMMLVSCEVIGDIFGAGVYTGIFLVILVVGIIIFFVAKIGKKG